METFLSALEKAASKMRRRRMSCKLFKAFDSTVKYGPFSSLKLVEDSNVSSGSLGAKAAGIYEQVLLRKIVEMGPFNDVVNFGSADGYYAIGLLVSGLTKRSICFEMTEKGREAIKRNASKNGCADTVIIQGAADDSVGEQLSELGFQANNSLIICDIEGAEFDVLSEKLLKDIKGTTLIVELHDRIMTEGLKLREKLIERLPDSASISILNSEPPDWRGIPEIEALSDNDRALVCSDGRKVLGEWLIVTYPPDQSIC